MKQKYNWQSFIVMPILLGLFFIAGLTEVKAVPAYGVTSGNTLISFDTNQPRQEATVGAITGLQPGETVLGIDFRPATGQLYALGSFSRLYTLNLTTGAATFVANLSVPLNGTNFGFDFNPTVDRIRIVSNNRQNLRVNPADGTVIVDGTLTYGAPPDPGAGQIPNITGAAYTNNFAGATTTLLYDIDSTQKTLVQQNPANSGTLTTVGALGVNTVDSVVGFDFYSPTNTAYALLTAPGNVRTFYTVNLATGAATIIDVFDVNVTSIAIATQQVTTGSSFSGFALTNNNQIVQFNTSNPGTAVNTVTVSGLLAGQNLLGIDFRPATGQLYGFGSSGTVGSLYTINTRTGVATFVGNINANTTGTNYGFDFNPTVDRIRLVNDQDTNLRINPADASVIQDGTLVYAAGDSGSGQNPNVAAAAYTNSFQGATTTSLYDIDSSRDVLALQNPANAGTLMTVGFLRVGNDNIDVSGNAGFDIARSGNTALAALQVNGSPSSSFYQVNLANGSLTFLGSFGTASPIISLALSGNVASLNRLDFDGDGRADYALFLTGVNDSTTPNYLIRNSNTNTTRTFNFAQSGTDIQTPGDYDGDGITDIAVYRRTTSQFFVLRSSDTTGSQLTVPFGQPGDEPVARDYDGDGRTDFAVVRRSGGNLTWFIQNSSTGTVSQTQFGLSGDVVAPGDYDGDGRFDLAVYRGMPGGNGTFFVRQSSTGNVVATTFGLSEDLVVPGDYDGDGKTDYAVLRQGQPYTWFILRSSDGGVTIVTFGTKPQFSAQNDYDGDGRTDIATYDPRTSQFFVLQSSTNTTVTVNFGTPGSGAYPIANYDTH